MSLQSLPRPFAATVSLCATNVLSNPPFCLCVQQPQDVADMEAKDQPGTDKSDEGVGEKSEGMSRSFAMM